MFEFRLRSFECLALAVVLFGSISSAAEPAMRVFEGRITDYEDEPVKNAAVEWGVFDLPQKWREVFYTDDDGRYRVETTKAGIDYRLGVSAIGLAPSWRDGLVPSRVDRDPKSVDFKLQRPISVVGKVLDETGAPIQGVTVRAEHPTRGFYSSFSVPTKPFPYPGPLREGTSDSDGKFVIRDLPKSALTAKELEGGHKYSLYARYPNGSFATCGTGSSSEVMVFTLKRAHFQNKTDVAGEIRSKVVDLGTRKPIKEFVVVRRHRPSMNQFSGDAGEFRMADLQIGQRYQLLVYADGYAPSISSYEATRQSGGKRIDEQAAIEERTIALSPNPGVTGSVTDEDELPIAGVEILFGLAPTDPRSPNLGGWWTWRELVDGYLGWETVQRKTTGEDGQFSFCLKLPLEPDESPPVSMNGSELKPRMMIEAPGYARMILDANEVERRMLDGDLDIQLKKECAIAITPQLNGTHCSDARISCSDLPRVLGGSAGPPELRDQTHRFGSLRTGRYRISARFPLHGTNHLLTRTVNLDEAGTAEITLNYQPGNGRLRGRSRRFSSVFVKPESGEGVTYSTLADADGNYVVSGIAEGKYNVSTRAASSRRQAYFMHGRSREASTVPLTIKSGTESTHNFDLKHPESHSKGATHQ